MKYIANAFLPLLILALLLPSAGPASAQSFQVAAMSAEASGNPGDYLEVKIPVTNISGKALNLRIEITDRSNLPEGWETQICFFQNCFPPSVILKDGAMDANLSEPLDIAFSTTSSPASGSVKVVVTNLDNTDEKVELTFSASTLLASADRPAASDLLLSQNYPNPFSLTEVPTTTIMYRMAEAGNATLKVYNLLGREVRTLVNEFRPIGRSSVTWNGRDNNGRLLPAGIYMYKLTTKSQTLSRRLMITR
ncbi:MAG: T9SS type A sorting domain-containing protein [Bacteroidetes bacterium]|nr:T9SS type A sorting domain-containing protein [Bacteroidota bacterium]